MPNNNFAMKSVGPPSLVGIVTTVAIMLWTLNDVSLHFLIDTSTMLLLLLAVIPTGEYAVRLFMQEPPGPNESPNISMPHWRWLVLPVASLLVFTTILSGWPMYLRFMASKPSFERVIEQRLRGEFVETPTWIGSFWVESISIGENNEVHFTTGRAVTDPVGLSYDQTNPKSVSVYVQLCPDWYGGWTY